MKTKSKFLKHSKGNTFYLILEVLGGELETLKRQGSNSLTSYLLFELFEPLPALLLEVPGGELEVLVVEEVVDKAEDDVWV